MIPRLYVNAYADGYRCAWCTTRDGADSEARALGRRRVGVWRTVSHAPGPGGEGVSDGGKQA